MTPAALTTALKEEAFRLGFDLAGATSSELPLAVHRFHHQWLMDGFAGQMHYLAKHLDAYGNLNRLLDGAKSVLMLAVNYRTVEPADVPAGFGRVSRYAWGEDYHEAIRERLHQLADFHRELTPSAQVRGIVDTAPLLERGYAAQAGLGWIGRNNMLINKQFGSWLFLTALLTTEELEVDAPITNHGCRSCHACLKACPTGALIAPYRLDARKCISYLTIESPEDIPPEYRAACGDRFFGCDACQDACPWNRETPSTSDPAFQPKPGMNPVNLSGLTAMNEEEFRCQFRHTPLWRAKREGLLRNAAVVMENQAIPSSSDVPP
jgi:epoxyqueuosine reductase